MDIAHQRLLNQHLAGTTLATPAAVVDWLVAAQAQDYAGAKWAIGLRLNGTTDTAIEHAFNEGTILRTHVLRPTWHFVTPHDIRWLLTLTAPRVHQINGTYYHRLELDQATFTRSHDALAKALRDRQQLTREELRHALQQAGVATEGELRLSYLLMQAELDGIICSGPRQGKQFTYTLLDERAPEAITLAREEALAELSRRYFISRGPATIQDYAKWSGLTTADARYGLEAVKAEFTQEVVDGRTYWLSTATPSVKEVPPTAYLLSIYDEYISGYKDRSALGDAEIAARLWAMGNALQYIIVVDGQIVGTWKRTLKKAAVVIETNLFRSLTEAENRAIVVAAHQYGDFLDRPVLLA
ncbi:MAG: winged helix DNA-binding domain-containing protein [Chloroflexota bacterium]